MAAGHGLFAAIRLSYNPTLKVGPKAIVSAVAGTEAARIIDEEGNSSFLQIPGGALAKIEIRFGTGELKWAAGSSAEQTVAHGLTREPKIVIPVLEENGPEAPVSLFAHTLTATHFTAEGWNSKAGTGTAKYRWAAIG
jgi:hypothetical protein